MVSTHFLCFDHQLPVLGLASLVLRFQLEISSLLACHLTLSSHFIFLEVFSLSQNNPCSSLAWRGRRGKFWGTGRVCASLRTVAPVGHTGFPVLRVRGGDRVPWDIDITFAPNHCGLPESLPQHFFFLLLPLNPCS